MARGSVTPALAAKIAEARALHRRASLGSVSGGGGGAPRAHMRAAPLTGSHIVTQGTDGVHSHPLQMTHAGDALGSASASATTTHRRYLQQRTAAGGAVATRHVTTRERAAALGFGAIDDSLIYENSAEMDHPTQSVP